MDPPSPEEYITLIGDSIIDNYPYVKGRGPCVLQQLWRKVDNHGKNWESKLLAVDGATTQEVLFQQIPRIPIPTTLLVISTGGNDGLKFIDRHVSQFFIPCMWPSLLRKFTANFRKSYESMASNIDEIINPWTRVAVCTIYQPLWPLPIKKLITIALLYMNSVIREIAKKHGFHVIDLYYLFDNESDYANSIEPSWQGGDKLTHNIMQLIEKLRAEGNGTLLNMAEGGYHEAEYETECVDEYPQLWSELSTRLKWDARDRQMLGPD